MNNIKDIERQVADTSQWKLMIYVSTKGLRAIFHNVTTSEIIEAICCQWDCSEAELMHRLQEAVYENPSIVTEHQATIIIESNHYVIAPSNIIKSEDDAEILLGQIHEIKNEDIWIDEVSGKTIAFSSAKGMNSFLHRTFIIDKVISHLNPLIYTIESQYPDEETMMAVLRHKRIDIAVIRNGQLLVANSYDFRDINDASYHILNTWQVTECDQSRGQLIILGNRESREKVTPYLEKFITYISPLNDENFSDLEVSISLTLKMPKA